MGRQRCEGLFRTHDLANRFADAGILQPAFFSVLLLRISDGPYLG